MAKKNAPAQQDNLGFDSVEQTLTKTEQFLESNAKQVGIAVGSIVAVVLSLYMYNTYVVTPNADEAEKEMAKAIKWFEADSMNLALNGNGSNYGFLDIIDEYGSTPAGNSAHYYAGIAHFTQGEFESAIEELDNYSASNTATAAMAKGVIGDAFAELGQMGDAAHSTKWQQTLPIILLLAHYSCGKQVWRTKPTERLKKQLNSTKQFQPIIRALVKRLVLKQPLRH